MIPSPPTENNSLASCTRFSQTDAYVLRCSLQSILSTLDGTKFIGFSVSNKSVAFLWILSRWNHRYVFQHTFYFGYSLTSGEEREIALPHFNCNTSVIKTCAMLWLTHFVTHYYPHIQFCITYIYLFLIWHLVYSALFIILGSLQVTTPVYQDFSFIYPFCSFSLAWWQKSTDFCTHTVMFNTIFHERCEINVAQEEACMFH